MTWAGASVMGDLYLALLVDDGTICTGFIVESLLL